MSDQIDCLVCGGTGKVHGDFGPCSPKEMPCDVCAGTGKLPAPNGKADVSQDTPLPSPRVIKPETP